ncbi:polymorphic toxin-type HINT domain-containing protein [Streptosporangium saharense]|uniref:polymorphic toxin-type HINT domain-containing protein n=1 Tax=Streptosporangium saharense TaxID=1706840 RepID=UPI0036C79CC1
MQINALPATAFPASFPAQTPETPDQVWGSAEGLPHLVDTKVTQPKDAISRGTRKTAAPSKTRGKRPPKGLPLDRRSFSTARKQTRQSNQKSTGSGVLLPDAKKSLSLSGIWITSYYPEDQAQVSTLTPELRAYGYNTGIGHGPYEYRYKVCPLSDEGEVGTCEVSDWLYWIEPRWTVPTGVLEWGKPYTWEVSVRDTGTGEVGTVDDLTFTTGVRQPLVGSQLAARGVNGQEFHQFAGNYTTTFTDASIATVGPPLSVVRSYNSLDPRSDGMFGAGWSTRFDMRIQPEDSGSRTLLVTYPDGRKLRFAEKPTSPPSGGTIFFQAPPGIHATLATVTGGGWRLMDKSSTSYLFDAQGRLTTVTDNRGRAQTLTYGTGGKLTKVTATGGRSLTFAWTGERVTTVTTDPVDGQSLTWTYVYDGQRLSQVCSPTTAPNCTTYNYANGSRYRETVLDDRPVGYWRMGDVRSEGGWEGGPYNCFPDETNLLGCAVIPEQGMETGKPGALSGTSNAAANFLGNTAEAGIEQPDLLPKLGPSVSVESWFKTTQSGFIFWAGHNPRGWADPEEGMPGLYVGVDGKLRGQLLSAGDWGGYDPVNSQRVVNNGQWHYAVITADSSVTKLYVDGTVAASANMGVEASAWLQSAVIGGGTTSSLLPGSPAGRTDPAEFPFKGLIDEFAVYDHVLTPTQIRAHYDARVEAPFKLNKVTLPSGKIWMSTVYSPTNDRVVTYTDQHGGTWKLSEPVYANSAETGGLMTISVTDPHNGVIKYEHDSWRGYRLVSEIDQLEYKTRNEYDSGGFIAKVTDRNGNVATKSYDERGNVLSSTTCRTTSDCQTEYFVYHVDPDNEFDPRNDQLIISTDARSAGWWDPAYSTKWEYDEFGEIVKETSPPTEDFPNGRSTVYTYTTGTEPGVGGGTTPAGLPKSEKDPRGNETTYRYTSAGDLAEERDPTGLVTKYGHDVLGRVVSRTEVSEARPDGVTTTFTYDGVGRVLTHTGVAVKNEVTGVTHTSQTRYAYDADGRKLTDTVVDLAGGDPERKVSYTYDAHGRVETITGPEGGVVRYTWDQTGARTGIVDELGNTFHYGYTVRGELKTRTLKNWTGSPLNPQAARDLVIESYTYDPEGRLALEADAMGRKTSYTYLGDDLLFQTIADDVKLNGATTTRDVILEENSYDEADNLVARKLDGGTRWVNYGYDAADRLVSSNLEGALAETAPFWRSVEYVYDANDNVLKKTRSGSSGDRTEVIEYAYNADDMPVRMTVENGAQDIVTTWTVDDRGQVVEMTDPRGNLTGADRARFTTSYRYDAADQLVEIKEPEVKVEKVGSVSNARPVTKYGYDSAGRRTHVMDAEGRTTTTAFDRLGRTTSVTGAPYTPPGGGGALTPATSYAYDAAGRITTFTDPRGSAWTTQYDALGNRVRVVEPGPNGQPGGQWTYEYDTVGELLKSVDPTGAQTQATYDGLGRQITATIVERVPTPKSLITRMEYDDADNRVKEISPGNRTVTYAVNPAGEVVSVTDPLGAVTRYEYDLAGRETKVIDPLDNSRVTEYDLAGRQTVVKDLNDGNVTQRTFGTGYDVAGNPITDTSGEGHIVQRVYDATNSLVELVEPVASGQSITTTFGYDATGELTRSTDGRGNTVWHTYNILGLPESTIEPETQAHPQPADRTWTSAYDATGQVTSVMAPGGVRVDRQYDHLGRLTKESGTGAQVTTPDRIYGYDLAGRETALGDYALEYNDRGLLTKVSRGTTQTAAFTYDDMGNVTQRVDAAGTATFGWDNDDRLKTAVEPVTARSFTYGYDLADRLVTLNSANPVNAQAFGYDAMDRITSHTLKNSSGTQIAKITYGWDKDDNLTSKTTSGTAGAGANTYGYDQAGRLTSWKAPNGNVTAYEWDASGNRTKAGTKTFSYDERNRLTSGGGVDYTYTPRGTLATETTGGTSRNLTFDAFDRLVADGDATYTYDGLGRLASRTQGGSAEHFSYSGLENDIAAVSDGAGVVQAKYGRDPSGGLLGLKEGSGPALGAMSDQHGDLVATFSGTALVDSTAYDPFGEVLARTGAQSRMGFQGEYTDPATGKVNMLARWYVPGTGGFASRDDVTLDPYPSINLNRYTYVGGDPLSLTDPSGNCPFCIPLLFIAGRVAIQIIAKKVAQKFVVEAAKKAIPQVAKKFIPQAVKQTAKQGVKQTAKQGVKQTAKQGVKQTTKQGVKQVTKQGTKQTTKQGFKQGAKNVAKKALKQGGRTLKKGVKQGTKKFTRQAVKKAAKQTAKKAVRAGKKAVRTAKKAVKKAAKKVAKSTKKVAKKAKAKVNSSTRSTTKNDLVIELTESTMEDLVEQTRQGFGTEPADLGDWDMACFSMRSCGKELVENLVENAVSDLVGDLIDEVAPDLPMVDPPGATCGLGGNSFVPGTPVLMADGSTKPIEDVKVGDQVVATDPVSGVTEARPVVTLITGDGVKNLVEITVDIDGDRGKATDLITATDEHPFWVPSLRTWMSAGDLQPGMWLRTSAGTHVQVTALKKRTATQRVHNLTVDGLHTYHVVAGNQAVLVHNDGWNPFKKKAKPAEEPWPAIPNATVGDLVGLGLPDVDGSRTSKDKVADMKDLDDEELMQAVLQPHGGKSELMGLYSGGQEVAQGNHRAAELLRRAEDSESKIGYDTGIFLRGFKKDC